MSASTSTMSGSTSAPASVHGGCPIVVAGRVKDAKTDIPMVVCKRIGDQPIDWSQIHVDDIYNWFPVVNFEFDIHPPATISSDRMVLRRKRVTTLSDGTQVAYGMVSIDILARLVAEIPGLHMVRADQLTSTLKEIKWAARTY